MSVHEFESWEDYIYRLYLADKDHNAELIRCWADQITKPDLGEFCNHYLYQIRKAMSQLMLDPALYSGEAQKPYSPSDAENLDVNKLDEDTVRVFLGERWAEIYSLTEKIQSLFYSNKLEFIPAYMYMLGEAVMSLNIPRDSDMAFYKRKVIADQERAKGLERLWSQRRDVKSLAMELADRFWSADDSKSIRTGGMAQKVMDQLRSHDDIGKDKLPKIERIRTWMTEVAKEKYPYAMNAGPPRKK